MQNESNKSPISFQLTLVTVGEKAKKQKRTRMRKGEQDRLRMLWLGSGLLKGALVFGDPYQLLKIGWGSQQKGKRVSGGWKETAESGGGKRKLARMENAG